MARKVTKRLLKDMNWRGDSAECCREGSIVSAFTFEASPQGHSYWWARHKDHALITVKDWAFLAQCERVYKSGEGK